MKKRKFGPNHPTVMKILDHFKKNLKEETVEYKRKEREILVEYEDIIDHPEEGKICRIQHRPKDGTKVGESYFKVMYRLLSHIMRELPKTLRNKCRLTKTHILVKEKATKGIAERILDHFKKGLEGKTVKYKRKEREITIEFRDMLDHPLVGMISRLAHKPKNAKEGPEYFRRVHDILYEILEELPKYLRSKCHVSHIYVLVGENNPDWSQIAAFRPRFDSPNYEFDLSDRAWIHNHPWEDYWSGKVWYSEELKKQLKKKKEKKLEVDGDFVKSLSAGKIAIRNPVVQELHKWFRANTDLPFRKSIKKLRVKGKSYSVCRFEFGTYRNLLDNLKEIDGELRKLYKKIPQRLKDHCKIYLSNAGFGYDATPRGNFLFVSEEYDLDKLLPLSPYRSLTAKEVEKRALRSARNAYQHAKLNLQKRFPEGESVIIEGAEEDFGVERIIKYVGEFIGGRWPEAEPSIMEEPYNAFRYAKEVIKGRWPELEKVAVKNKGKYKQYLTWAIGKETKIDSWREGEKGWEE